MGALLRVLAIVIALILIIAFIKRVFQRFSTGGPRHRNSQVTDMRPCAHCGTHIPADQALTRNNDYYCCEEHRQAGPRN